MIMAARALGLDCGPMSGFDEAKVDEEFFSAGKPCFGCDQEFAKWDREALERRPGLRRTTMTDRAVASA